MPLTAEAKSPETFLCMAGEVFRPVGPGALWWQDRRTLIVSDLHFEKGSNFASRGQFLPPYDTGATLSCIESLVGSLQPSRVISLGDSFHDPQAETRLGPDATQRIRRLTETVDWLWVEGNHDPDPPAFLGGTAATVLRLGACIFRHEPTGEVGEIAGHLHPVAKVGGRGRAIRCKSFVTDGQSLIMPSLGAFTGGLNVLDPAFSRLFPEGPMVFAVNETRVHLVERAMLRPDRADSTAATSAWRFNARRP